MPFVHESILPQDKKLLRLAPNPHFYRAGKASWTADHERNIFLLSRGGYGPEGPQDERLWAFFWRGLLLDIRVRALRSEVEGNGGLVRSHLRVIHISAVHGRIDGKLDEILRDLQEALTANAVLSLQLNIPYEACLEGPDGNPAQSSK